ncbi:MAG: nucleotide sugar dehydrogenase [Gammaproteobacteria bacterium]
MRISVFGLGYVGAVSLACLARDEHDVTGVDVDPHKLDMIRSGKSPIVEEGIQELMRKVVDSGRVKVTNDVAAAVRDTEISFVCVGTPSSPNGGQDLGAIRRVMEQIGTALKDKKSHHTIVLRSTVQPGTVETVVRPALEEASGRKSDKDFSVCFQPEFLREGTSIKDYDNPPLTIVGAREPEAAAAVKKLFEHLPCEFVTTSIGVAELMKYACNAFHAVKITFANEIGRVAQSAGVDAREVMDYVCRDKRLNISPAYLKPGFAFGGSCLPKDLRALNYLGKTKDLTLPMMGSILGSNRAHIDHALDKVMTPGVRRVGMLGLSFKAGTDDLRESPLVSVAERLIGKGFQLKIFDSEVNLSRLIGANKRFIEESIPHIGNLMVNDSASAIENAQVVIVSVATKEVLAALASHDNADLTVVDLVGLPRAQIKCAHYSGICW